MDEVGSPVYLYCRRATGFDKNDLCCVFNTSFSHTKLTTRKDHVVLRRKAAISDSPGDTKQSVTSSPCYVNAVPADDEEKFPVSEPKQYLKESMERYIALLNNVLSLLHIIVSNVSIAKVSPIDDFVNLLINLYNNQGGEEQSAY